MARSWRDVVAELADPDSEIGESIAPEWDGMVVAELAMPGAVFRIPGETSELAWRSLAHQVGDVRLIQSLEKAGWDLIEEVVDQTTYVVARDPDGKVWAIGVASPQGDRRGYIESDIGYDERVFDRIAFVEPLDTRDSATLLAALEAAD